jgi:competence protein ComFB
MRISERYNIDNIINKSAEMVMERLESILEETENFCKCEECVLDLIAYTLNHVTPLYRTSLLGPLHPKKEKIKKVEVEIDLAIKAGIKKIRMHPHHGETQQSKAV